MSATETLGRVSRAYGEQAQELAVLPEERWLPIPEWEGIYSVSDLGRIYSVSRQITTKTGVQKRAGGKYLRPGVGGNGRETVTLYDSGSGRMQTIYTYIAVLLAFVGPRPPGNEGRHLDGNERNNRLTNLSWGTHLENIDDMLRHGTKVEQRRTHCPRLHPLEAPNLVPGKARGARECLACSRARSVLRREVGYSYMRLQEVANEQYQSLVATPGRRRAVQVGERNTNALMTDDMVRALRVDRAAGATYRELAAKYGIARITAQKIALRERWGHVE